MTSEEFRNNELFLRNQFDVSGRFDMPNIQGSHFDVSKIELIGFDQISSHDTTNKWVHFFLDDYKFESVYNHPHEKVEKFEQCAGILTPNFSMYVELPLSLQIYNTFKSRWVGAFMQMRGIPVIPTVSWGDRDSFSFCFDGIEPGFIVAVSTIGVKKNKSIFLNGYEEMLARLRPFQIICYGKPFEEMVGNIIEVDYAQTNHLKTFAEIKETVSKYYYYMSCDFIENYAKELYFGQEDALAKGMGSASGEGGAYSPKFPEHDSQIKHIFRKREGHIDDTPANRQMLLDIAGKEYYSGTDRYGKQWYGKILPDGRQIWICSRNNVIQNAGINESPVPFDPETGFSRNPKKYNGGRLDTTENTNDLLLKIVNNEDNYDYTASNGDRWYTKEIGSGQIVHVRVRDGRIVDYQVEDGDSLKCYTLSSPLVVPKFTAEQQSGYEVFKEGYIW